MRQLDNSKLSELKSILYKVYKRDDTADSEKLISELMRHWGLSRNEVKEYLWELEEKKVIKWDRKLKWVWLEPDYAFHFIEKQTGLVGGSSF